MGKGRRFDKKNATTFSVVHRSHEDSLYFDNDAPAHVLVEAASRPKEGRAVTTAQLAQKLKDKDIRANEGLAAQYGITYDDSKYDYMQHLRPMGQGDMFIEALEEPKRAPRIQDIVKEALPSGSTRRATPDDLENIPRDLQGFNPDMDPRLREVMEALEDEEYVEDPGDDDNDVLAGLLESGAAPDGEDFEELDEWDMDNYLDHFLDYLDEYTEASAPGRQVEADTPYAAGEAPEEAGAPHTIDTAWENDFMRYKKTQRHAPANEWDSDDNFSDEEADTVGEMPAVGKKPNKGKARRRMGAMTDTSLFSMSSSAVFRTQGLVQLDGRYEQLAKQYEAEPEEQPHTEFRMENERPDLEAMLDDFLDTYEMGSGGRKLVKKDKELAAYKRAADSVSRGKLAQRSKDVASAFANMKI